MILLEDLFLISGAIALFLYGLKILSNGISEVAGEKMKRIVQKTTSNRLTAVGAGALCTAVAQSSVATNMIVITFVEKGVLNFISACAVIMGTNIGTTITAQLVSLSTVSEFDICAIGGLISFIGFLLTLSKNQKRVAIGSAMLGFGFIFTGIKLLTEGVERLKAYSFFTALFLVENPLLLLLNGFFITAILQSSSVVTSILTVLASIGILKFQNATFIILGANIGTCLPVIFASLSMSKESIKSAVFNIAFNIFGSIIFFLPLVFFGDFIYSLPVFSSGAGRAIANFHTLFNIAVCLILLPVLKQFCTICERVTEKIFFDFNNAKGKKEFLPKGKVVKKGEI